jgi:PPOX class probable F420-dependent enzyme
LTTIDFTTEFGQRALNRLENEQIVWMTTTSKSGAPQPSPVWFVWEDDHVLIFSQPNTPKLRGIERNPQVSLNFNSNQSGDDVVVFSGTAEILGTEPSSDRIAAYQTKYGSSIVGLGYTPESFAADYSVVIRVTLEKLRGF